MLMQQPKSEGPEFLNSNSALEMGPITFVKEGQDLVVWAPFGDARVLDWGLWFTNGGGLSTACNSCYICCQPIMSAITAN